MLDQRTSECLTACVELVSQNRAAHRAAKANRTTILERRKNMNRFRAVTTLGCLAFVSAILTPGVKADDWDRRTVITFTKPVEIPGVHLAGFGVLPPGTYVFRMLDPESDPHTVQIFDTDESALDATTLPRPNHRLQPTDKTVTTLSERPADQPEA